jgi:hypothetical protein
MHSHFRVHTPYYSMYSYLSAHFSMIVGVGLDAQKLALMFLGCVYIDTYGYQAVQSDKRISVS